MSNTQTYSITVPYNRHMYHVAINWNILHNHMNNVGAIKGCN